MTKNLKRNLERTLHALAVTILVAPMSAWAFGAAPPAAAVPKEPAARTTNVADAPESSATCTFTNPGFSGKCVEIATVPKGSSASDACHEILQCLENPSCTKTYCQATTIRSGWKLESATPRKK